MWSAISASPGCAAALRGRRRGASSFRSRASSVKDGAHATRRSPSTTRATRTCRFTVRPPQARPCAAPTGKSSIRRRSAPDRAPSRNARPGTPRQNAPRHGRQHRAGVVEAKKLTLGRRTSSRKPGAPAKASRQPNGASTASNSSTPRTGEVSAGPALPHAGLNPRSPRARPCPGIVRIIITTRLIVLISLGSGSSTQPQPFLEDPALTPFTLPLTVSQGS